MLIDVVGRRRRQKEKKNGDGALWEKKIVSRLGRPLATREKISCFFFLQKSNQLFAFFFLSIAGVQQAATRLLKKQREVKVARKECGRVEEGKKGNKGTLFFFFFSPPPFKNPSFSFFPFPFPPFPL